MIRCCNAVDSQKAFHKPSTLPETPSSILASTILLIDSNWNLPATLKELFNSPSLRSSWEPSNLGRMVSAPPLGPYCLLFAVTRRYGGPKYRGSSLEFSIALNKGVGPIVGLGLPLYMKCCLTFYPKRIKLRPLLCSHTVRFPFVTEYVMIGPTPSTHRSNSYGHYSRAPPALRSRRSSGWTAYSGHYDAVHGSSGGLSHANHTAIARPGLTPLSQHNAGPQLIRTSTLSSLPGSNKMEEVTLPREFDRGRLAGDDASLEREG